MPWNETSRREYARHGRRYASDLTDREWALIAPFQPARKKIGRPRTTELRDALDAIFYMASTGCQWAFAIVLIKYFFRLIDKFQLHRRALQILSWGRSLPEYRSV